MDKTIRKIKTGAPNPVEPDSSISSPLNATEVLEWLRKANWRVSARLFNGASSVDNILERYTPQEIVEKITTYETSQKAPKPVEVECGYRCNIYQIDNIEQYELWGVSEEAAKNDAINKAMQKTEDTGVPSTVEVQFICRVKESL